MLLESTSGILSVPQSVGFDLFQSSDFTTRFGTPGYSSVFPNLLDLTLSNPQTSLLSLVLLGTPLTYTPPVYLLSLFGSNSSVHHNTVGTLL